MSRPRIFVINDYSPLRDLLRINLKVRGFEVRDTPSHSALVDDINQASPDLVILDLVMDNVDGFEVCRQVCESGLTAVIVINLRSGESDMLKCLEMGVDDYISKPFGVDELMARIEASLRHRKKVNIPEPVF